MGSRLVVDLWLVDLTSAPPPVAVVSAQERHRADGFATDAIRNRFLVRTTATRTILAEYTGTHPRDLIIDRRCLRCGHPAHGRPRLGGAFAGALEFSASSSGDLGLVAVSESQPVGVDMERVQDDFDPSIMAAAGLPVPRTGSAAGDRAAAFGIWVRHEAALKAVGAGLGGRVDAREWTALSSWNYMQLEPAPGYAACVATPQPVVIQRWRAPVSAEPSRQHINQRA